MMADCGSKPITHCRSLLCLILCRGQIAKIKANFESRYVFQSPLSNICTFILPMFECKFLWLKKYPSINKFKIKIPWLSHINTTHCFNLKYMHRSNMAKVESEVIWLLFKFDWSLKENGVQSRTAQNWLYV